ncbi:MAG: hypothetical protein Tsb0034_30310 [Ekhidna sp.]
MSKPLVNTHDLVESDFRKIQKLLLEKHGKEYTLDYIRKVCKQKRNNEMIRQLAEQYMSLLKELENKIEKLSKNNEH